MGLWDTIKDKTATPKNSVNDDIAVVMDPVRGAPVSGQRPDGLKFRPVTAADVEATLMPGVKLANGGEITFNDDGGAEKLSSQLDFENPNFDLVGDVPAYTIQAQMTPQKAAADARKGGRPRKHQTNAQRQKAYRDRHPTKKKSG
jgi:hypothetical protein